MIHMINHVSAVQVNTTLFPKKKKKNVARVLKESPFEVERMYFFSRTHTSLDIKCRCCADYAQIHSGEGDSASRRKKRGGGYVTTLPPPRFVIFVRPRWQIAVPELWPSLHPGNRWGCGRGVWKRRIELRGSTPHVGNTLPS